MTDTTTVAPATQNDDEPEWKPSYSIRSVSKASRPGAWNIREVEVLGPTGDVVGTYTYNYSMTPPFCPFEYKGEWYALYAKDYTATRIMNLPSCEDVWGQDRNTAGFCPVEFFVPASQETLYGDNREGKFRGSSNSDFEEFQMAGPSERLLETGEPRWVVQPVKYADYGFMCGCVWGDDSSWKIRFIDLAKLDEGVVTIDDRFGYVEMNPKLSLRDSVQIYFPDAARDKLRITLYVATEFKSDGSPFKDD